MVAAKTTLDDLSPWDLICDHTALALTTCSKPAPSLDFSAERSNLQDIPTLGYRLASDLVGHFPIEGEDKTTLVDMSFIKEQARIASVNNLRKLLQDANVGKLRAKARGDRETYIRLRCLATDLRAHVKALSRPFPPVQVSKNALPSSPRGENIAHDLVGQSGFVQACQPDHTVTQDMAPVTHMSDINLSSECPTDRAVRSPKSVKVSPRVSLSDNVPAFIRRYGAVACVAGLLVGVTLGLCGF